MSERFKSLSAVMLILVRQNKDNEEVLFQKRKNTGYCDGFYELSAAGHVEANDIALDNYKNNIKYSEYGW